MRVLLDKLTKVFLQIVAKSPTFAIQTVPSTMQVEKKYDQLVITIPTGVLDVVEVQTLLDYLKYRVILARSKATEKDMEELSESINQSWWEKSKQHKG